MPNYKQHLFLGGLIGFVNYLYSLRPGEEINLLEISLNIAAGAGGGIIQDKIEPSFHPNHRAFFHSAGIGALELYGYKKIWNNPNLDIRTKRILTSFFLGSVSHISADMFTPKSIPWLGLKVKK